MKVNTFTPASLPSLNLKSTPASGPEAPKGDGVDPTPPEQPTPVWKKVLNTAVGSVSGGAVGTVLATAIIAANVNGPDALGAPILGVMIGGPIGLVAGAVAGWKNCGVENPSVARKLVNAATWAVIGAGIGAVGAVGLAASGVHGPDALGSLFFAAPGAAVGAAAASVVGWKMTKSNP